MNEDYWITAQARSDQFLFGKLTSESEKYG